MNIDLYNYSSLETGALPGFETANKLHDLVKAISATHQTGRDLTGQSTSGSALKAESLDPVLKILTNRDKHIVLWKMIPKQKAYNTVEEFNQLVDYGLETGVFNNEGETPEFSDSIYRRQAALVKYMGISGEVTHPATLVRLGSGVGDILAQEIQNKTQFLLRSINRSLPTADSAMVSNEFDGIFKQHYSAVASNLDAYYQDSSVVDARGSVLLDKHVENAAHSVVNDNFGMISDIITNPQVLSDYATNFHESKNIFVGSPGAVVGATMGQSVNDIQTQFGRVNAVSDIFFDRKTKKLYNAAATSAKSPAKPTKDGSTPVAVITDTSTKFGDGAGSYFYAVTAKNRYGESAMELLNTTTQAVQATESVDLKFGQTDGAYAAESFVIYRTEKNASPYATADFYPIMTVSVAQKSAGFDGGTEGLVRDRNRVLPNTHSAIVLENSTDVWAVKQLAPLMKMDLAITSPAYKFMILAYLVPVLFAGKKISRIVNIGRTFPS